jgi:hypothetical protein
VFHILYSITVAWYKSALSSLTLKFSSIFVFFQVDIAERRSPPRVILIAYSLSFAGRRAWWHDGVDSYTGQLLETRREVDSTDAQWWCVIQIIIRSTQKNAWMKIKTKKIKIKTTRAVIAVDYRCENGHFPVSVSCVTISNLDSLSRQWNSR